MSKRQLSTLPLSGSILNALGRAGYETIEDLNDATPEVDLDISMPSTQAIFSATQLQTRRAAPLTQSAAFMVDNAIYSTKFSQLDTLLGGGLKQGFILELSGPPGCIKELLAVNLVSSFIEESKHVIFVDMQNMTSPATLNRVLPSSSALQDAQERVQHLRIHALPDLLIFLRNLPSYLQDHPSTSLLVLNSLSYPFQSPAGLSNSARNSLLDRVKQMLTRVSASTKLSVVITSQLATKLLKPDGSAANFETGSRAIMSPALGPAYLPAARTYRVCVVPQSKTTGIFRLLSSPSAVQGTQPPIEEAYQLEG
ncbi:P-loop containing nucleoside triphosphate hydrolase protein [Fomitopsis betulina]|nr:P-loop containing nucleoside triphosphate hydrolase protein [Fomitopsis betulina]